MAFDEPKWYEEAEGDFNRVVKFVAQKQGVPPSIALDSLKINKAVKSILDHIFEVKQLIKVSDNQEKNSKLPFKFQIPVKMVPKKVRIVPKKYKKSQRQKEKEKETETSKEENN